MQVMLSWFAVKDLAKARQFYGQVLGLEKQFEMEGWAEYAHAPGAASIGLSGNPAAQGSSGATVVLRVENLDQARKDLAKRGVQFDGDVEEVPGIVRLAAFRDPFGNRLQLAQVLIQS